MSTSTEPELWAVADFCLLPMALPQPSVAKEIARCQEIIEESGLEYHLHGYGTNLEGPWSKVTETIGKCHLAVHAMGCQRIATDIRIGTRIDKEITGGGNAGKVTRVEGILAEKKASAQ